MSYPPQYGYPQQPHYPHPQQPVYPQQHRYPPPPPGYGARPPQRPAYPPPAPPKRRRKFSWFGLIIVPVLVGGFVVQQMTKSEPKVGDCLASMEDHFVGGLEVVSCGDASASYEVVNRQESPRLVGRRAEKTRHQGTNRA